MHSGGSRAVAVVDVGRSGYVGFAVGVVIANESLKGGLEARTGKHLMGIAEAAAAISLEDVESGARRDAAVAREDSRPGDQIQFCVGVEIGPLGAALRECPPGR